ncbi:MAG: hypothetical protein K8U03_24815 [Planctomycetia bacterium]|nr:hypothetical protein [Planctomycetia bacterium]
MPRPLWIVGLLLIAGAAATLVAQPPAGPPGGPPERNGSERNGPPRGPGGRSQLMEALDADKDGKLSAEEIKNASAALAQLDKNQDGILTEDEIRPGQGRGAGRPPEAGAPPAQGQPRVNAAVAEPLAPGATQTPLLFSGGNETDPRDRGRPVVLIAGALGVTPEVFREAFSRVRPAGAGSEPAPEQVRQNKAALMQALGKFGISNERLDEVSNYYRYVGSRGESWPITPAKGYAKLKDGKVTGFVITSAGSGYSSPPSVTVQGLPDVVAQAKLSYGKEFSSNGSVAAVTAAN